MSSIVFVYSSKFEGFRNEISKLFIDSRLFSNPPVIRFNFIFYDDTQNIGINQKKGIKKVL